MSTLKKKFSDYASERERLTNASENGKNSSYSGNTTNTNGWNGGSSAGKTSGLNSTAFDMLKRIAGRYEGASEAELINAIMAEAAKARAEGRLSDKEIDSFVAQIAPMLDKNQQKRLVTVAEKIKKG